MNIISKFYLNMKHWSYAVGLYIILSFTNTGHTQECLHIDLPYETTEIRVPADLKLLRINGRDTMTPSGYWLYHSGANLALSGPAKFCLERDIVRHVDILANLIGQSGSFGPLIEISNSYIDLDLNKHVVRSNRAGIAIKGYLGGHSNQEKIKNLAFRNGVIDIRGKGIQLTGWQYNSVTHNYRPGPDQIKIATNWYGPNFREFEDTNVVLENLTIKSAGLATYLVGRNNIIRHCHIEVDGHEALALFGANNQLIDNEIIIKRSKPAPTKPDQPPARLGIGSYYEEYAAIWIRDAPGLIIRGNKITIEGLFNAKEAIMLINSPGVVIENNTVTGSDKLYTTLDTTSSAYVRNNRTRFGSWPDN